jgi:hypothetical protein
MGRASERTHQRLQHRTPVPAAQQSRRRRVRCAGRAARLDQGRSSRPRSRVSS